MKRKSPAVSFLLSSCILLFALSLSAIAGDREISLQEEWKKVIDVQMHFNDMLMRLRQIGISAVIAVFGAAAVAFRFNQFLNIRSLRINIAAPMIIFGLGLLAGTWYLDHKYYFQMLIASVEKGQAIDEEVFNKNGKKGLTTTISQQINKEDASLAVDVFYLIPLFLGIAFLFPAILSKPGSRDLNQRAPPEEQ